MLSQSIIIALEMLRNHKMRAFLTMLGVIIGVMSVTVIIMLLNGFQAYLNSQFEKAGSDVLYVSFDRGRGRRNETTGGKEQLTMDDMEYLKERCATISQATPMIQVPVQSVKYGDREYSSLRVFASDQNFLALNGFDVESGRNISKSDVDAIANACMIGEDVRDQLFGKADPIGNLVLFNGIALEVVGVIKKASFLGDSTARMVLVPYTTAQEKWIGGNRVDMIMLRPKPGVKSDDAMDSVWQALMIRSGNRPIYRVDSNESISEVLNKIIGVLGMTLAAIAALSLLVGGIGIMNIMLVSVTERTKEIGLRKAVGAKRSSILVQFLVESATLSLVGGLIGMFIAWSLGNVVTIFTANLGWMDGNGLSTPFPVTAAIMAAAFSAFIGAFFGLYPAISASKMDPIVALRHE